MKLIPHVPMMFQGEDYGETNPFCFFADFTGELAKAMQENRVTEAENFGGMPAGKTLKDLPDCMTVSTFERSKLDWRHAETHQGREQRAFMQKLIALRQHHIAPLIAKGAPVQGQVIDAAEGLLAVDWDFPDGTLSLRMNLTEAPQSLPEVTGSIIYATDGAGHIDGKTLSALPGPGIAVAVNRREPTT
jgi:1,4-alpha-glucan branching enzyme